MRVAFAWGMTWAVEMLEQEREHAAQCAVALTRGDHPEVLETAAGAERVGDRVDKPA